MSEHETHESHGHSVAAWTGVTFLLAAFLVMSLAIVFPSMPLFIIGVALGVIGVVAGVVLKKAGRGATKPEPPKPLTADAYAADRR